MLENISFINIVHQTKVNGSGKRIIGRIVNQKSRLFYLKLLYLHLEQQNWEKKLSSNSVKLHTKIPLKISWLQIQETPGQGKFQAIPKRHSTRNEINQSFIEIRWLESYDTLDEHFFQGTYLSDVLLLKVNYFIDYQNLFAIHALLSSFKIL